MEILSTGEKIKRARIYKGFTLREICLDKISVSKLSCIENDKVKPEDWVLDFIAERLEVDKEYLKQDVREQLVRSIDELEGRPHGEDFEKKLEYYLNYAEQYKYHDISFRLMHLLFNHYITNNETEKLQSMTSKYYDYYQKSSLDENQITYHMDIARYLYRSREYLQSANYYNNVRKTSKDKNNFVTLAKATYNEAACYVMLENYERAYEIAVRLEELVNYLDGDIRKAEVFHMLAMLSLRMDKGKFEEFETKSYELYKHNFEYKASAIYNYAVVMFDVELRDRAIEYMERALECYPKDNKMDLVEFMISIVDELIENNVLDLAQTICDDALNIAINLDNIKFIERAYYFKSLILQKQDNLYSAEMYMNLSLDSLMKFGSKQDIYKRYMEMGYMYYNLGYTAESIKYFSLALNLEKRM